MSIQNGVQAHAYKQAKAAIAKLNEEADRVCKQLNQLSTTNDTAQKLHQDFLNFVHNWREEYKQNHPNYPLAKPPKPENNQLGLFGEVKGITPKFAKLAIDKLAQSIDVDFCDKYGCQ